MYYVPFWEEAIFKTITYWAFLKYCMFDIFSLYICLTQNNLQIKVVFTVGFVRCVEVEMKHSIAADRYSCLSVAW